MGNLTLEQELKLNKIELEKIETQHEEMRRNNLTRFVDQLCDAMNYEGERRAYRRALTFASFRLIIQNDWEGREFWRMIADKYLDRYAKVD